MSIELPVATSCRHDMTEKLLNGMINPNKQQQLLSFRSLAQMSVLFGQVVRGLSAGSRVFEVNFSETDKEGIWWW